MRRRSWIGVLLLVGCGDVGPVDEPATGAVSLAEMEGSARAVLGQPNDLRVISVRQSLTGDHVRFGQVASDGTPVVDLEVSVHFDGPAKRARPRRVFDPASRPLRMVGTRRLPEADARERARLAVGAGSAIEATAVALPMGGSYVRPGWRVLVSVPQPAAVWEVWVDADDGSAQLRRDLLQHVAGSGYVFRPNAMTSTGNLTLVDNNNATSAALDAARYLVTLTDLDGSGFLRGTYADVQPGTGTRTMSASETFLFDRSQTGFEETNVYFHITNGNHNLQSLGFTGGKAILNRSVPLFVNEGNADNSFYSPVTKDIHYGAGGVDDAEDGDVVIHEYGHAVLDNIVPGFGSGGDAGGMGEGFGDTLAISTPTGGPDLVTRACVAPWDATSYSSTVPPCLRRVDGQKHYPEFLDGEVHDDGEVWSGAIWEMYQTTGLGPAAGLKLVVEAAFAVPANTTYPQYAQAVIDADTAIYAGAHVDAIKRAFWQHGILLDILPPAPFTGTVQSATVSFSSPNPIPNLTDAKTTITHAGAGALRLHFSAFSTRTGGTCLGGICDRVYLFDGTGHLYARLGGALGAFDAPPIPGDTVVVRWVTNASQTSTGFTIDRVDFIAATAADAGVPDAASPPDAPAPPDASPPDAPPLPPDASPPDAAPPTIDAAPRRPDAATTTKGGPSDGCGCRVAAPAQAPPWALLSVAALGVATLRRRGRRR